MRLSENYHNEVELFYTKRPSGIVGHWIGAFSSSALSFAILSKFVAKDKIFETEFLSRSSIREVMGYAMKVAMPEDVLQGKLWAYSDEQRRKSKRQKDLADIYRLVESYPALKNLLPESIKMNL